MAHGGHGGAGTYANGREVGSEGVPQGVDVYDAAAGVGLGDGGGLAVGVEDGGSWRAGEEFRVGGEVVAAGGYAGLYFVYNVGAQGDGGGVAALGVLGEQLDEWRGDGVGVDLADGEAHQFLASQAR